MKKLLTIFFALITFLSHAQTGSNEVLKGNEAYKKGDYKNAESEYDKALKLDGKNFTAQFNKANAMQKQGKVEEAAKEYAAASEKSSNLDLQSKALYNKGVTEAKQKQWEQAASSFKKSLRLNPDDAEARDNLQKVLNEIKKQQQGKKPEDKKKDDKKNKEDDKPKEKKQQPKMNRQQMENELNRLRNEEKLLQQDLQKQKLKSSSPEKDW